MHPDIFSHLGFKEGVFAFFTIIGMLIFKFLSWIMPKTAKIFIDGIRKNIEDISKGANKDLIKKVDLLAAKVEEQNKIITLQERAIRTQDKIIKDQIENHHEERN